MKKSYNSILSLGIAMAISTVSFAQAINEGFDDVTTLPGSGWAQQNLSTPIGSNPTWGQGGNPFTSNSGAANSYVAANYNSVAGAGTISNWLFAPTRTFNNGDIVRFYARSAGSFADNIQVRLSLNGASVNAGSTNVSVGDFTTLLLENNAAMAANGFPTVWTQYSVTITGLGAPTSGRIAIRYYVTDGGPSGSNSNYIGIDDFEYIPFGTPATPDVTVINPLMNRYPIVPISQLAPIALGATIKNVGLAAATDAQMTVNVYEIPNPTPVYTETSTAAALAVGATSAVNFTPFMPTATVADYYIEYVSTCTNNTSNVSDSAEVIFQVDDSTYARDYANVLSVGGYLGIGAGAGQDARLGQTFTLVNADTLTSVDIFIGNNNGSLNGQPLRVHIYSTASGVPTNTVLGTSNTITMGMGEDSLYNLSFASPVILSAGTFAVAVEENDSNITVGNCPQVFENNSIYVKWNGNAGGAWTAVENFGANFSKPFVIRPNFGVVPVGVGINQLSNTEFSVYPNPATEQILINNAVVGSTVEIINAIGQSVYSNVINSNNHNVNVANYEKGMYIVRISKDKEITTNSFVKQ